MRSRRPTRNSHNGKLTTDAFTPSARLKQVKAKMLRSLDKVNWLLMLKMSREASYSGRYE